MLVRRLLWVKSRFLAPSEAFLIKGGFERIVYMVAESFAKRTKKAIIKDYRCALSGKREFNLCSPIILGLNIGSGLNFIQKVRALSRNKISHDSPRFFRFTFEFRRNSFDRFSGTGIAILCPP